MRPGCKVHVADWTLRHHQAREHLGQIVGGDAIAVFGVDDHALVIVSNAGLGIELVMVYWTYEWSNDTTDDERDYISPRRQGDVVLQNDDQAKRKADHKYDHIPPPWRFFVVFCHMLVVAIVVYAFACALVSFKDIFAPEKDGVGDESADLR